MVVELKLNVAAVSFLILFTTVIRGQSTVFDVVANYGAKANGQTDLKQPLLNAWKAACASITPAKVVIPKGTYSLSQATLKGPCKAVVEFQVQGLIKAPESPSAFKEAKWVVFSHINQLTVSGGGVFDGEGAVAWDKNDCANKNKHCGALPSNLRFNYVNNSIIQDIPSKDSKHLNINVLGCQNITFQHVTVSAPENSINTDGIHIGRSNLVKILNSNIQTGDDCVSMVKGSKNVFVEGLNCGPDHGISVGSLGKDAGEEPVSGIFVKNCTLTNTQNGVRIKTWPTSNSGLASDIHFEDIILNNVRNPILIDQEYCPRNKCNNLKLKGPSRVKLSDISFKSIRGTSSTPVVVKLVCSSGSPCEGVELADIDIIYRGDAISPCSNVKPRLSGIMNPMVCTTTPPKRIGGA